VTLPLPSGPTGSSSSLSLWHSLWCQWAPEVDSNLKLNPDASESAAWPDSSPVWAQISLVVPAAAARGYSASEYRPGAGSLGPGRTQAQAWTRTPADRCTEGPGLELACAPRVLGPLEAR
jgi:hypothetical protein